MMSEQARLEFFARCASGFEPVLGQELKDLRIGGVRPLVGGVSFRGTLWHAYRACMWSRVATRVQLVLARVPAADADQLYASIRDLPWADHIAPGATIAVRAHGQSPTLRNTQFTALKVKDAVCDCLRDARGSRPDVDAKNPDLALDVTLHGERATVTINLSGQALHRRGYREEGVQTEAPLKETLAAGVLLAAGWQQLAREGAAFVDPMCGSGTLAIEAALIAEDRAPGLLRKRWGFEGWLGHDVSTWQRVVEDAERQADQGASLHPCIIAGDLDKSALAIARDNARRAGVGETIRYVRSDAAQLPRTLGRMCRDGVPDQGLIATNPPYGHRLQCAAELPETYAALAKAAWGVPTGWDLAVITPDLAIDTALGLAPRQVIDCYNGPIATELHLYSMGPSQRQELGLVSLTGLQRKVSVAEANSSQFAGRLRKVAKDRARWALKEGIASYRIYDADLPDYALSIDLYQGAAEQEGSRWLRVCERQAPATVDPHKANRRFFDAIAIAEALLDVPHENVIALRGRSPMSRDGADPAGQDECWVHLGEGDLVFEANLAGSWGAVPPLSLREVRARLLHMSRGTRFVSLYSFAGWYAACAARGGAAQVTLVDPSQTFVDVARKTLEDNGLFNRRTQLVRADVMDWLHRQKEARKVYDLVFCDLAAVGEQLRREFLKAAVGALAPRGTIMCLACLPDGKVDMTALTAGLGLSVEDVSAQTLPRDFERSAKDHHAYLLHRG